MVVLLLVCGVCAQGQGPFCGIVGTEGCTAVPYYTEIQGHDTIVNKDPRIIAWATGCEVVFGPVNIEANPDVLVTYAHSGDSAIGPAWTNGVYHVVPLGDGGYATLTFDEPIHNVIGYDFAVFENSFNDSFLELAFVEVSSDGERFVRFPATSLTQTETQIGGIGTIDATYINNLAGKYRGGWGTPFDLEELRDSTGIDINNITHVRVVDVVGSIDPLYGTYDAYGHIINDPFPTNSYSNGFDLDAVAVLGGELNGIEEVQHKVLKGVYPNPATTNMTLQLGENVEDVLVEMYDMSGRRVSARKVTGGSVTISTEGMRNGLYIVKAGGECVKLSVSR